MKMDQEGGDDQWLGGLVGLEGGLEGSLSWTRTWVRGLRGNIGGNTGSSIGNQSLWPWLLGQVCINLLNSKLFITSQFMGSFIIDPEVVFLDIVFFFLGKLSWHCCLIIVLLSKSFYDWYWLANNLTATWSSLEII